MVSADLILISWSGDVVQEDFLGFDTEIDISLDGDVFGIINIAGLCPPVPGTKQLKPLESPE